MEGELKCPHCGSNDVIECPVGVFEDIGEEMPTMTSPGFDPFKVLYLLQIFSIPKNAAVKAYDAITDRKRYKCRKCEEFFYK